MIKSSILILYYDQDGQDVYYILEESVINLHPNETNRRLFVIEKMSESLSSDAYSLTVYGSVTHLLHKYKGASNWKLNYVKGIVAYLDLAVDLPSKVNPSYTLLCKSKTKQEEKDNKIDGTVKFAFKKHSSLLEQINESAELSNSEIESYRIDQLNIKDTLLTLDNNDVEHDFEIENDQLYDEVDEILKTESDELSQIKNEAIMYDNRNMRFMSKDSFTESNELLISQKSDLDGEMIYENPRKELGKAHHTSSSLSDEIRIVDKDNVKLAEFTPEKSTFGAVVSPNKLEMINSAVGMSTVTLDTIVRKEYQYNNGSHYIKQSLNSDKEEQFINKHLDDVWGDAESDEASGSNLDGAHEVIQGHKQTELKFEVEYLKSEEAQH